MYKFIFLYFCFSPYLVLSQPNPGNIKNNINKLSIYEEERIARLLNRHISINKNTGGPKGYRLQILSNRNRKMAWNTRLDFILKFPEIAAYVKYDEPYFKVVIGDFFTRLEALKVQDKIKKSFISYIVPSVIEIPHDKN